MSFGSWISHPQGVRRRGAVARRREDVNVVPTSRPGMFDMEGWGGIISDPMFCIRLLVEEL